MEVEKIFNQDRPTKEPKIYKLDVDSIKTIFVKFIDYDEYLNEAGTTVEDIDIALEECRFFKNNETNKAKEGLHPLFSIDLADRQELIYYYCNMPERYPILPADELLRWGEENGITDLPPGHILDFSIRNQYCVSNKVADLIQKYLLQFKWVRLEKDPLTGKYVEINEDDL